MPRAKLKTQDSGFFFFFFFFFKYLLGMSSILSTKGLAAREAGMKAHLNRGIARGDAHVDFSAINMDNVHNCSLYELRQVRRDGGEEIHSKLPRIATVAH